MLLAPFYFKGLFLSSPLQSPVLPSYRDCSWQCISWHQPAAQLHHRTSDHSVYLPAHNQRSVVAESVSPVRVLIPVAYLRNSLTASAGTGITAHSLSLKTVLITVLTLTCSVSSARLALMLSSAARCLMATAESVMVFIVCCADNCPDNVVLFTFSCWLSR